MPMGGKTETGMPVNPTIGIGFTPCGLPINATKPFGDYAFFSLLFMPDRSLGFSHHLIRTDNFVTGQVQEIAEK